MSFAIGIDLGTSTSEICVYRNGGTEMIPDPLTKSPIVPSVVAVNTAGELVVGEAAEQYLNTSGRGVREVKRRMGSGEKVRLGDNEYSPEQVSACILRHLKANAEVYLGQPLREVVISVPANFPEPARQATLAAADMAGLHVLRLINEPTAAALAFGFSNVNAEEQLVVFDFGGGTLDITTLEMTAGVMDVQASFGDTQLGGKDFDEAMVALLTRKMQAEHPGATLDDADRPVLKGEAEKAKRSLSSQRTTMVNLRRLFTAGGRPVNVELMVSREEYEQEVTPLLERARQVVRRALSAGQLKPSAIDRVLLVGGTTYMPCVRQLVSELFNKEPRVDPSVHPDTAVATGAALHASVATRVNTNPEGGVMVLDGSPFGVGVDVIDSDTHQLEYSELMAPNTKIPFAVKKPYRLTSPEQKTLSLKVYQDHTTRTRRLDDKKDTQIVARITDIPPAVDGVPHEVVVDFGYDINGTITLNASIPNTKQKVALKIDKSTSRPSAADDATAKRQVDDLWKRNPNAARYEGLITRANKAAEDAPTARGRIATAVSALQDALARNDEAAVKATSDALTDLLFDLQDAG